MSEYIELLENARDALRALIRGSEPGSQGVINMNVAYRDITGAIEREGRETQRERPVDEHSPATEIPRTVATAYWTVATTVREREHHVLNTLADERLTITEVFWRLIHAHPEYSINHTTVTSVVTRLFTRSELDREPEPYRGRTRYRYYRRDALEGEIANLDAAFRADSIDEDGR